MSWRLYFCKNRAQMVGHGQDMGHCIDDRELED